MSAERPSFQPQKPAEPPLVLPESFLEAIKRERPDNINWDRIDEAVAILKKPPEPEPTEKQKFWRDMYRSGKLTPYQKDRPWLGWQAAKDAWNNPELQGESSRIMALDMAIRGGADKPYNQLGSMPHRIERMGVMVWNLVPFTAFDILTSIPGNLFLEGAKRYKSRHAKLLSATNTVQSEKERTALIAGLLDGSRRGLEIANDKFTTALGDWYVKWLTGDKGAWTREPSDKTGDFLDGAVGMYVEDAVNGPVVESVMRFIYEIPVVGALIEQGWTRLAAWQESSPFTKATGKAVFGGLGIMIGTIIQLKESDKEIQMGAAYKKPTSPSKMIAQATWSGGEKFVNLICGHKQSTTT